MPSEDAVEGKPTKVVVFEFDNGGDIASQVGLNVSLASNVESAITEDMVVQIIDRNAAAKMKKEIELAEINKSSGEYKGPLIADYAVSGTISNASFNSRFIEESVGYNPILNQYYKIPAKFNYSSQVSGNIKIYQMPSMSVVQTFQFSGSKSRTEDAPVNTKTSFFGFSKEREVGSGKTMDAGLVSGAGSESIENIKSDLKNFFAKRGYILEKRVLKNKTIFKVSLGSADGLKRGDKFEIIQKREEKNSITDKSEISEVVLGEGVVSDIVNSDSAWVIVKNDDILNVVRLGDIIKMKYKNAFFKSVKNALD
jgi:hypothetical protein